MNKSKLRQEKLFLSLIILVTTFLSAFAQSGETPEKDSSPHTKEVQLKKNAESFQNFDKYKIIFAPVYEGKLRFKYDEVDARLNSRHSQTEKIIDLLNIEGNNGYKLVSGINNDVFLVRRDESSYEYEWFETLSYFHYEKNGLQEKIEQMSRRGFRIAYHNLLSTNCESIDPKDAAIGDNCEYLDFYMVARDKDSRKPIEQIMVSAEAGWGAKPSADLEAYTDAKLAEGFYPVNVFSPFEILLEKSKDKLLEYKPDVQVVRSGWGRGDVLNKANELAKQGYRLAMANNRIAILYRNSETAQTPVSYVRVHADKKNFEKEVAELQKEGAIFRTIYPTAKGVQNTLLFEVNLKKMAVRTELKVLKFEFVAKENTMEQKVYQDLTPASKETLKTLNNLVKEGFEVRSLFTTEQAKYKNKTFTYEIGAILERRK